METLAQENTLPDWVEEEIRQGRRISFHVENIDGKPVEIWHTPKERERQYRLSLLEGQFSARKRAERKSRLEYLSSPVLYFRVGESIPYKITVLGEEIPFTVVDGEIYAV